MKYVEFTYSKTKNLGNYESEKVEFTVQIDEGDEVDEVVQAVKNQTELSLKPAKAAGKEDVTNVPEKKAKKATKKTTKKKPTSESKKKEDSKGSGEDSTSNDSGSSSRSDSGENSKGNITLAEVQKTLKSVWKKKGENIAKDILKDFGVEKSKELDPKVYPEVMKAANACLK
jgi:hypothetical protein